MKLQYARISDNRCAGTENDVVIELFPATVEAERMPKSFLVVTVTWSFTLAWHLTPTYSPTQFKKQVLISIVRK